MRWLACNLLRFWSLSLLLLKITPKNSTLYACNEEKIMSLVSFSMYENAMTVFSKKKFVFFAQLQKEILELMYYYSL